MDYVSQKVLSEDPEWRNVGSNQFFLITHIARLVNEMKTFTKKEPTLIIIERFSTVLEAEISDHDLLQKLL